MKTRFSTYDLVCSITELQRLIGMRVSQVYDIDHRTYLFKLQRSEEKAVLLLESGNRMHTTAFEWPKNVAPSGFSMKLRKHLKNKRLESLKQLGIDRIVDLQFGSGEAAYHVMLELYDKGNIILADCNYIILNVLRPHTEGEEIRFVVREKYPLDRARQSSGSPSSERLHEILANSKQGDNLKKILNPCLEYGAAVIDHVLLKVGLPSGCKLGKGFDILEDIPKLLSALDEAERLMEMARKEVSKGYIIQKHEKRPTPEGEEKDFFTNIEFHPVVFKQHSSQPFKEFDTFDAAVDEYFSALEGQKIDMKAVHQEKEAMKKLENVRKDHVQRLSALEKFQEVDKQRAELITRNQPLVDNAILAIRSALANQMSWPDIQNLVSEARTKGDPVASKIKGLKLEINHISLLLSDPYECDGSVSNSEDEGLKPMIVDVDLDLSAYANAKKYYTKKRSAAKKQQKTIESQSKALKSAERKTKQTLKEVQAMTTINKARKVFWFEKFFWFISSENYLIIGGRDQQQNELIVKRYMKPCDIYVHADIQGASSIVIKNPTGQPVPPKTLNEAGVMAVSYSVAWDAKVVTNAWWVQSDQVSKTAPAGEYLTTGSFMVRGKKNYLPSCHLVMGFGFLFKLEESSVDRHKDERRVRNLDDDVVSVQSSPEITSLSSDQDQEIDLGEDSEDDDSGENGNAKNKLEPIEETVVENGEKVSDNEEDGDQKQSSVSPDGKVSDEESAESSDEEEKDEQEVQFPDTEIHIEHVAGNTVTLHTTATSILSSQNSEEDTVVYLGDDKPVIVRQSSAQNRRNREVQNKSKSKDTLEDDDAQVKEDKEKNQAQQPLKRGQKARLKKMKEKYKYQDEEERKLRMAILQSAGTPKEGKKSKKQNKQGKGQPPTEKFKKPNQSQSKFQPFQGTSGGRHQEAGNAENDGSDTEVQEEVQVAADVDMVDSLTGLPIQEDELLFAVPVVAPYNTLANYKFKVKLTPGTGRRGKAAKTALNIFLNDKTTSSREKDLLRSVKDQDLARNIPGKVKVSAPQLQKHKK